MILVLQDAILILWGKINLENLPQQITRVSSEQYYEFISHTFKLAIEGVHRAVVVTMHTNAAARDYTDRWKSDSLKYAHAATANTRQFVLRGALRIHFDYRCKIHMFWRRRWLLLLYLNKQH